MTGQVSVEREAANRLLADGEWHAREEVVQVVMAAVLPGLAYRAHKDVLTKARVQAGSSLTEIDTPTAVRVEAGKRALANQRLQAAVRAGQWERSSSGCVRAVTAATRVDPGAV